MFIQTNSLTKIVQSLSQLAAEIEYSRHYKDSIMSQLIKIWKYERSE